VVSGLITTARGQLLSESGSALSLSEKEERVEVRDQSDTLKSQS
jgi:hypothetical protein